jgi:hypothetical protein
VSNVNLLLYSEADGYSEEEKQMLEESSRISWFDQETGSILLSEYFQRMDSWQRAMADGKITAEEIRDQSSKVIELLKEVEPMVNEAEHQLITEALYEMAVLQAMQASAVTSSLQKSE